MPAEALPLALPPPPSKALFAGDSKRATSLIDVDGAGVLDAVDVGVAVQDADGEAVRVPVALAVDEAVCEMDRLLEGVEVSVTVAVREAVDDAVGVNVGDTVSVPVLVVVNEAVAVTVDV